MTKGIRGTNRKDDNFTKKVVNFMQFFMCLLPKSPCGDCAHSGKSSVLAAVLWRIAEAVAGQ